MAMREHTDQNGVRWTVWQIEPRYTPVRAGIERRRESLPHQEPERRAPGDRRRRFVDPMVLRGWLCFESAGERRRLTPVPADWENCPECTMDEYVQSARPAHRSTAFELTF